MNQKEMSRTLVWEERKKSFLGLLGGIGSLESSLVLKRQYLMELLSKAIPEYRKCLEEGLPSRKIEMEKEKVVAGLGEYFGFSENDALFFARRIENEGLMHFPKARSSG